MLEPGNQDYAGLMQLAALARALKARSVFEIGTYNGVTALMLALNLPDAKVHTLDLHPEEEPALPLFEFDSLNFRGAQRRAYEGRPEAERIVQHLGDSASFDFDPLAGSMDLVYVDGAHSYEYIRNDTDAAFNLLSERGGVVWDDYWRLVPDVPRFLDGIADRTLYRIPGTRLVVSLAPDAFART
jgi:predicted O-methyltransferase YrrM